QKTADRLRDGIVDRPLRIGSIRPEAADGAVDQLRIDLDERVEVGAETCGRTRPEILDINVRLRNQLVEYVAIALVLQVEADGTLVAVIGLEMGTVEARLEGTVRVATVGRFHLDDVCAKIRQHHPGTWPG